MREGVARRRSRVAPLAEPLAHPSEDARFEDLRERYAAQVAPASAIVTRVRMLSCDRCARTFLNFEGLDQEKPPGKHRCGGQLRWVWVE